MGFVGYAIGFCEKGYRSRDPSLTADDRRGYIDRRGARNDERNHIITRAIGFVLLCTG